MSAYFHVYTGDGKGKTTAALGLALRAAGAGWSVFIGQFAKGQPTSELDALRRFDDRITIRQFGREELIGPYVGDVDREMRGNRLGRMRHGAFFRPISPGYSRRSERRRHDASFEPAKAARPHRLPSRRRGTRPYRPLGTYRNSRPRRPHHRNARSQALLPPRSASSRGDRSLKSRTPLSFWRALRSCRGWG